MLIYGHRGAAGEAPENSLAGVRHATQAGCGGVEVDVWALAGRAVVLHDPTVDRTTDGSGLVGDFDLEGLRALQLGQGQRIPLLEEVVALCAGVRLNVELKEPAVATAVATAIADAGDVLLSSFDSEALSAMRELCPSVPRALCATVDGSADALERAVAAGCVALHVPVPVVDRELVRAGHAAGLQLATFTCNDAQQARALRDIGCDALFTDVPSVVVPAVA